MAQSKAQATPILLFRHDTAALSEEVNGPALRIAQGGSQERTRSIGTRGTRFASLAWKDREGLELFK